MLIHIQMQDNPNLPSFFAMGQLEGYSDYGSAAFRVGCYLMDLHQPDNADPEKAEPPSDCPPNGDKVNLPPPPGSLYWMTAF